MNYKLVAIDMDGTLLNSKNQISDRTIDAINKAKEKGVYVVFATGRMLKSALNYSEKLNLNNPIISCNGSLIIDENKDIIYSAPIDMTVVDKVIDIGSKYNNYYHFYSEYEIHSLVYLEDIQTFYNKDASKEELIKFNIYDEKSEILLNESLNVYKFLFMDKTKEDLKEARKELEDLNALNISNSWSNNLEITRKDVSKGNSVKYLCEKLGIDSSEVIAIGDNNNDLSMLEYAGLSVAMGNASDEVKEITDVIADTNDNDGVAKIIEEYILK